MNTLDYLSASDLSLRSFISPDGPVAKCRPLLSSAEPWNTLFVPYGSFFHGLPPSPTDTCASFTSTSTSTSATPPLPATHVICNAPLVAPVPLPYHSPTFLQFEELPDIDEDLSHPPYVSRPTTRPRKRKQMSSEREEVYGSRQQKRRIVVPETSYRVHTVQSGPRTRHSTRAVPYQLGR